MIARHSGSLTVHDPAAAHALLDVRTTRLLDAFLDEARSTSEVARELNEDLDWVRYRVRRLTALGLLRGDEERRRKGRAMRLYRAVATVFFVPFEVTRYESLESYLTAVEGDVHGWVRRNVAQTLRGMGEGWGLRVARGEDGRVHSKMTRSPDEDLSPNAQSPALLSFVYPALSLKFEDAKAMQADLLEVFGKYAALKGTQRYLCQLVMCPVSVSE
ncbi:helix-turn-helix transcriptional regulator [Deinococcus yavapaiensis]|uniref:Uncharacterized protein n=1 Tax=Deinococcus yavapaiensis KR-236 TaxID=694435 RepID=A0A318S177_9DEIO|nr:helix-turn-helix transcriptional regulator [Deinococcus yavapaiensis]PYE50986.1 hypothetical protein DES52_11653 [Deinococcus yavapaiensis KR-236]